MSAELFSGIIPTQNSNFNSLLQSILTNVCESTEWEYGEAWIGTTESPLLQLSPAWWVKTDNRERKIALEQFRACSQEFIIEPGEGLPGRVWSLGTWEWLVDATIESETYFLRNQIAKAFGIKSGLGIPLKRDRTIQAVLTFFLQESRPLDFQLLEKTQQIIRY